MRTKHELTIRVYCWCFLSQIKSEDSNYDQQVIMRLCTSTVPISKRMLSNQRYLWSTTTDTLKTRSIERIIFNKGTRTNDLINNLDSRFLLLIDRVNGTTDTVVYIQPDKFAINSSIYEYPFKLLDSIHYYLGVNKFDCQQ